MAGLAWFVEILTPILVVWIIANIVHALVTTDSEKVGSAFFCISNWLKKKGNGEKKDETKSDH